jgi:shikimate dehydrogenase
MSGARRAAVAGSPISHSLSPALHRAAYAALGLSWTYDAIECDEAGLPALIGGIDASWAGLSLTMPLKRAVIPLLDRVSPLASAVAAVNTVVVTDSGLVGDNTDVPGLVNALTGVVSREVSSALVLGGGATAASALAALQRLGFTEPTVAVRSPERARDLLDVAERIGVQPRLVAWGEASADAELVLSTVPAGAADALAERLFEKPSAGVVFDVVYAPWPTSLAQVAAASGRVVVGGFELLVHQAALQVELMTGLRAPLEAMRAGSGHTVE